MTMETDVVRSEEQARYERKQRFDSIKAMEDLELVTRVRMINSEKEDTIYKKMVEELSFRFSNLLTR